MNENKEHFILLDIETTGFSPQSNEITEIAAIKVNTNTMEIVGEFESLIAIKGNVPPKITDLTGITNYLLLKEGKDLSTVLQKLVTFCGDHNIYAHYAPFDKSFIRHYLSANNILYHESQWIDTINIFKKYNPNLPTYKLAYLMTSHGLGVEEHRGLSDAKNTLQLLKIFMNQ